MWSCLSCSDVPDRALAVRFRTGGVRLARQSDVRRALALAVVIARRRRPRDVCRAAERARATGDWQHAE